MLSFLWLASRAGIEVLSYEDDAVGTLSKNERGKSWLSEVVLRPRIAYGGNAPSADEVARLHGAAHDECFIASSVRTNVRIDPT